MDSYKLNHKAEYFMYRKYTIWICFI